jgi:hypothetical protein
MPPPDRPADAGYRIGVAATVKSSAGVINVHAFQRGRKPVRVAFPAHLTIGDNVQAGLFLRTDRQQCGVTLCLLQPGGINPP